MASERIEEFRGVVDKVIERQVRQAQRPPLRRSWLGYDSLATAAGLTFISAGKDSHSRGSVSLKLQSSEHIWSAEFSQKQQIGGRAGRLSIASTMESSDSLYRVWRFDGAMKFFSTDVVRELVEVNEIDASLAWVRSPHLESDAITGLAELTDEETEYVDVRLTQESAAQAQLSEDLARLAEQRRRPMPNIFIG